MTAPILVTGATGNTGGVLTRLLRDAGANPRPASRTPAPGGVRFDWTDPATHAGALDGVERLYLIAPVGVANPEPLVRPFLERGVRGGLRRVVLLSSSAVGEGDPGLGLLHRLVRDLVPEWTVLRPSWFMQNFLGDHPVAQGLRAGRVTTATGTGRVAFVDAADIAAVAARALLDERAHNTEHIITGPQALSYAKVCELASQLTGAEIRHVDVSAAQLAATLRDAGFPADFAAMLASLDEAIRHGAEDRVTDAVPRITGHPARSVRDFLAAHADDLAADRVKG